ncbi:MAG: Tetratricopeptide repeat protein [bacterium ADurb.Bin425]|nr:MAG: Tetratricopeptide repeat protein [bacterium ADurb.Bin425]
MAANISASPNRATHSTAFKLLQTARARSAQSLALTGNLALSLISLAALIATSEGGTALAQTKGSSYDSLLRQATQTADNGNMLQAINNLTLTIEKYPNRPEAFLHRALVRRQIGDLKGALLDLDKALALQPNYVSALIQRAAVRHRLSDSKAAKVDIERAVSLAPGNAQAYAERSAIKYALGDLQGALADYNTSATINPEMGKRFNKALKPTVNAGFNDYVKVNADQDSKGDSKGESKAESKLETKPETRTETRAENKAEPIKNIAIRTSQIQADFKIEGNGLAPDAVPPQLAQFTSGQAGQVQNQTINTDKVKLVKRQPLKAIGSNSANLQTNLQTNLQAHNQAQSRAKNSAYGGQPAKAENANAQSKINSSPGKYTSRELAHLNNEAAKAISAKQFDKAIDMLEKIVSSSPGYMHARDNLVIAHNNRGLQQALRNPKEAIKEFRAALFLDTAREVSRRNLNSMMKEAGLNPLDAAERSREAAKLIEAGDLDGAFVELSEALRLQNDRGTRMQLARLIDKMENRDSEQAAFAILENSPPTSASNSQPNAQPYIEEQAAPSQESSTKLAQANEPAQTVQSDQNNHNIPNTPNETPVPPSNISAAETAKSEIDTQPSQPSQSSPPTQTTQSTQTAQPTPAAPPAVTALIDNRPPAFDSESLLSRIETSPDDVLIVAKQFLEEGNYRDSEIILLKLVEAIAHKSETQPDAVNKSMEAVREIALESLALIYQKQSRLEQAETKLKELLKLVESKSRDELHMGKINSDLARLTKTMGKLEESAAYEAKANLILNKLSNSQQ